MPPRRLGRTHAAPAPDAVAPGTREYLVWTLLPVVAIKVGVFLVTGVYYRAYRYTNAGDVLALLEVLVVAEALAAVAAACTGLGVTVRRFRFSFEAVEPTATAATARPAGMASAADSLRTNVVLGQGGWKG